MPELVKIAIDIVIKSRTKVWIKAHVPYLYSFVLVCRLQMLHLCSLEFHYALPYHTLPCPVLSYHTLPCPVLPYHTLPCPVLSYPALNNI